MSSSGINSISTLFSGTGVVLDVGNSGTPTRETVFIAGTLPDTTRENLGVPSQETLLRVGAEPRLQAVPNIHIASIGIEYIWNDAAWFRVSLGGCRTLLWLPDARRLSGDLQHL